MLAESMNIKQPKDLLLFLTLISEIMRLEN